MSKPKRLVVFFMLPFVALAWLVGWCISGVGAKKADLKTKGPQYIKLQKLK